MSSADSSKESRCARQPSKSACQGLSQDTHGSHHRSKSARLSGPSRASKMITQKHELHRPGTLREGDCIEVFSRTANEWLAGEISKFLDGNLVRVEYAVGEDLYGKVLHLHSEHLNIPSFIQVSADDWSSTSAIEEVDPKYWHFPDAIQPSKERSLRMLEELAKDGSVKAYIELLNMRHDKKMYDGEELKEDPDVVETLERVEKAKGKDMHKKPDFLTKKRMTGQTKTCQNSTPVKWAMTLKDWNEFINACVRSDVFQEIKYSKRSFEQFVSVYDINEYFVKPWTRGTGCGIALHMNPEGLDAQVMLSHAWAEDVEELQTSLNAYFDSHQFDGLKKKNGSDELEKQSIALWFCTFAQYQPGDGEGPSLETQLDLRPFTSVIADQGLTRMIAIHTTRADLWERLWCVREAREALSQKVQIDAAFSEQYVDKFKKEYSDMINSGGTHKQSMEAAGIKVRTSRAKCLNDSDRDMLLKELQNPEKYPGGLSEIDKKCTNLRKDLTRDIVLEVAKSSALDGRPQALTQLIQEAGDLKAVDVLHEVAKDGGEKALDKLCEILQGWLNNVVRLEQEDLNAEDEDRGARSLASSESGSDGQQGQSVKNLEQVRERTQARHVTQPQKSASSEPPRKHDNQPSTSDVSEPQLFYLAITLFGVMANQNDKKHPKSFEILTGDPLKMHLKDYHRPHDGIMIAEYYSALAGNEDAFKSLKRNAMDRSKKNKDEQDAARKTLMSLVHVWHRESLRTLLEMEELEKEGKTSDKDRWAHNVLDACRKSLISKRK